MKKRFDNSELNEKSTKSRFISTLIDWIHDYNNKYFFMEMSEADQR